LIYFGRVKKRLDRAQLLLLAHTYVDFALKLRWLFNEVTQHIPSKWSRINFPIVAAYDAVPLAFIIESIYHRIRYDLSFTQIVEGSIALMF